MGKGPRSDDVLIRREALMKNILVVTTISGAYALSNALEAIKNKDVLVKALQEYFL